MGDRGGLEQYLCTMNTLLFQGHLFLTHLFIQQRVPGHKLCQAPTIATGKIMANRVLTMPALSMVSVRESSVSAAHKAGDACRIALIHREHACFDSVAPLSMQTH